METTKHPAPSGSYSEIASFIGSGINGNSSLLVLSLYIRDRFFYRKWN